jgi:flagella basal body P-ring formation protein FlgA
VFRPLSLLLCATCLASPGAASAAALRAATTLHAPVVRLSDLFDGMATAAGDRVLGPGPAPGTRIVVEAAQLAAIARQFDVDWRPASAADRAVLDRPGQMLPREMVLAPLRAALVDAGAPADMALNLPDFSPPMVAEGPPPEISIEQIDYDNTSGHFTASVALLAPDMPTQRLRLSGHCDEMADLVVPTHRLPAGAVIGPADLRIARLRATLARGDVVRDPAQAIGHAVRHLGIPGQPIPLSDLTLPEDVHQGGRVTMELQTAGLSLSALGIALRGGVVGDHITVMNPNSRAVLEADIIGPDRVRVSPGSFPALPRGGLAEQAALR